MCAHRITAFTRLRRHRLPPNGYFTQLIHPAAFRVHHTPASQPAMSLPPLLLHQWPYGWLGTSLPREERLEEAWCSERTAAGNAGVDVLEVVVHVACTGAENRQSMYSC